MIYQAHVTRRFAGLASIAVLLAAAPALAAPLSGGGSGGGAIEGGSGAPGSGVGIPGAIVNNTTAEGIGEDDTLPLARSAGVEERYGRDADARAFYPLNRLPRR